MTSVQLYSFCRSLGYPMKKKAFQRDLNVLQESGFLKIERRKRNPRGMSPYVIPVGGENREKVHM